MKKIPIVKKPAIVDISPQPYDKYLKVIRNWHEESHQSILNAIHQLMKYRYSCLSEVHMMIEEVSSFHKEVNREKEKT